MLALGLTEDDGLNDALEEGETEALGDIEGETEDEGDKLAEGEIEAEIEDEGEREALGETDADGLMLALILDDGERDADGEIDGEIEELGLLEADGDKEAEGLITVAFTNEAKKLFLTAADAGVIVIVQVPVDSFWLLSQTCNETSGEAILFVDVEDVGSVPEP